MTRGLHSRRPQNWLLLASIIGGEQSPHLDIQPGALARPRRGRPLDRRIFAGELAGQARFPSHIR